MCTRVFNNRNNDYLTTARNMDWNTQLPTSLFSFKSGLEKSALDENQLNGTENWYWTSKYSSVVAMVGNESHGYAASDGINSEGLVANVLYDKGSNYELIGGKDFKKLNVLRWVQYVLDNFKSVIQVVHEFKNSEIELLETMVPGSDSTASLHLSVSDANQDSAIIEVYDGKYHIHHNAKYSVMTNEPSFNVQLKLNDYWLWQWSSKNNFQSHTIPGGPFPADRFERATFYYSQLKAPTTAHDSLAQAKSIVANASVPIGMQGFEGHPNIAPTLWTTISDHNQLIYYFCNARTPNVVWIEMDKLGDKNEVTKIDLVTQQNSKEFTNLNYVGCVNSQLEVAKDPFCPVEQLV